MTSKTEDGANRRRRLLVTGVPTDAVVERASAEFDAQFWREADPIGDRLLDVASGFEAVLIMPDDKLDAERIGRLPASVEVLGTHSVGYDHIDLDAATARRLPVFNTPDVLTDAVADLALFLVLAAARGTTSAEAALRRGEWGRWAPTLFLGRSLSGLRLGIFGMGRIGQAIALRATAFGLRLHYHNRTRLAEDKERGAQFHESLESLLSASDVFCICAPSTPQLRGSIDSQRLALLPRGAIVVNVARGDLVDETALFAAVQEGRLGAIGTDVYRGEPNIDARWLELSNATLLPHIGSATHEVRTAMGMLALDGIHSHFSGAPAANLLNPQAYAVKRRSGD